MKSPKTLFLLSIALSIFGAGSAFAQRETLPSSMGYQINGQVRYAGNNAPAENVLVRVESFKGGMISPVRADRSGKFTFSGLTAIQYIVTVTAPGFADIRQDVDLQTQNSAYLLLTLRPNPEGGPVPTTNLLIRDAKMPDAALKEYEKGRTALVDNKKPGEAASHLEKAVSAYPNYLEAHLLLGTVYMDLERWDKAENELKRVLKINDHTAAALFALGEVYLQGRKYKEAEQDLQAALRIEDNSWRGHLTLGRVYFAMGDLAKAGPEVGRAIQLKPDLAEAHLLAGSILFKSRQADKALPLFEEYLKLDPNGRYAEETRDLVEKIKKALGPRY